VSSRRPRPTLSPDALTIVWQSVSLLLDYPDEELLARADLLRTASGDLPSAIGDSIRVFLDHLAVTPLPELQADYVETFDTRRRCVVLEFAATVDQELGRDLILDHRAGLELLRLSLRDMSSPWAHLIDAVTATLPPLRGDERDAVRRLAAEGPPEEEVGLAPFASPQFSPGAAMGATPAISLPMPSFPGART
jgi:nitrate reductase molybdenum cofactor assembly chaperone NarJ/NarW